MLPLVTVDAVAVLFVYDLTNRTSLSVSTSTLSNFV